MASTSLDPPAITRSRCSTDQVAMNVRIISLRPTAGAGSASIIDRRKHPALRPDGSSGAHSDSGVDYPKIIDGRGQYPAEFKY